MVRAENPLPFPTPYRGNIVPAAKTAVAKLRILIADLLHTERDRAMATLATHESRIRAVEDFMVLDESSQQQALAPTSATRQAIEGARFVTGIRDRLQRYTTQDYPAQLALASRLAASLRKSADGSGREPAPVPVPVRYTAVASLRPQCNLPYIATQAELDQWLAALRAAIQAELDKGNRISL